MLHGMWIISRTIIKRNVNTELVVDMLRGLIIRIEAEFEPEIQLLLSIPNTRLALQEEGKGKTDDEFMKFMTSMIVRE